MSSFPIIAAGKEGRREGPNICCAAAVLNIKDNRAAELESDKARTMFVSFSFSYLL